MHRRDTNTRARAHTQGHARSAACGDSWERPRKQPQSSPHVLRAVTRHMPLLSSPQPTFPFALIFLRFASRSPRGCPGICTISPSAEPGAKAVPFFHERLVRVRTQPCFLSFHLNNDDLPRQAPDKHNGKSAKKKKSCRLLTRDHRCNRLSCPKDRWRLGRMEPHRMRGR